MRNLFFFFILLCLPSLAQGRLESEFKLAVPQEQTELIWKYLNDAYGPTGTMLRVLGPDFTAKFATEGFIDEYFDTTSLPLLKQHFGLRFRSRVILEGSDHTKDGRQLVQLKLSGEDETGVVREEFKFKVRDNPYSLRSVEDGIPVVGLIKRSERDDFTRQMNKLNIEPRDLSLILTLNQNRRRAYISRKGIPFATITLDQVSAVRGLVQVDFVEMELELNEIAFTDARASERAEMTVQNTTMRDDLFGKFPELKQDQTPKYNKGFAYIKNESLFLDEAVRWGVYPEVIALGAFAILLGFVGNWCYARLKRRRKSEL